jgi:hypothetical protein
MLARFRHRRLPPSVRSKQTFVSNKCLDARRPGESPAVLLRTTAPGPVCQQKSRLALRSGRVARSEQGCEGRAGRLRALRIPAQSVPPRPLGHFLLQKVAHDYCCLWLRFERQSRSFIRNGPVFRWVPDTAARRSLSAISPPAKKKKTGRRQSCSARHLRLVNTLVQSCAFVASRA